MEHFSGNRGFDWPDLIVRGGLLLLALASLTAITVLKFRHEEVPEVLGSAFGATVTALVIIGRGGESAGRTGHNDAVSPNGQLGPVVNESKQQK